MGFFVIEKENALCWRHAGEVVKIMPWGKNSLRVRSVLMHEIQDTDYALLEPEVLPAHITIKQGIAEIANGNLRAAIEIEWRKNCRISFYNEAGKLLFREIGNGGALNQKARSFSPILGGDFKLTASFESEADEKLYGMGQYQQDIMDLKGCMFELAHRNSQVSVPFVLSSAGYGFLWHNPAVGQASFAKNRTQWTAESTKQLDYWVTAGNSPAEIVERYAEATGKVPMMPDYGLGFWQCKLRYWNQKQLLETAREYKRRGLPIDVIVCDFFHWPKMGDFRFDEEFYPDPAAMAKELKEMGIELMVSVWPQISLESENFEEMLENGLLIRAEKGMNIGMQFGGDSIFFDATNPEARAYVWDQCRKNYYDNGIKVFWLDEAEPEYAAYDFDNYRYHMGPNVQIGNIYPQKYSQTFYEGLKEQGHEKIVNLVRCAWAGSQRYGALVWSGDIHCDYGFFRKQIAAGLHMGICGLPWWTTDIGGFSGGDPNDPDFRELLVRWFQYGTFCPVMRLHGDRSPTTNLYKENGEPALFTGADNEVWSFGDEAYHILVRYLKLRETMKPYTKSLMRQSHEKGSPVIRTMFYEFPGDLHCWDCTYQYMYGPDLLVAPIVYEHESQREVYLPGGSIWTNMHDGTSYEGGQTVSVPAPLDIIPVFIRDNSHPDWIGAI